MSLSKSFRFKSIEDKEYVTGICNKLSDKYKDEISIQGDALVIIAKAFEDGIQTIQFKEVPTSAQYVLKQVPCDFIRYDGDLSGYMCYENFYRKKKGEPIGAVDELVIQRCKLCMDGKEVANEKDIQKQLRKTNIKKLLDLREILINLTRDSARAQIYLCRANLLEGHSITICADGIHLVCPLNDGDSVSVIEYCYNQVDPTEMNPPCRYLIDPYINVKMDLDEDTTTIINDLVQIEHQSKEKIKREPKIVNAEFATTDIEPNIEPETTESEEKEGK